MTTNEDPTKRHYHAQALSRGVQILRAIAMAPDAPTIAQLHETTALPKSTLVRLIAVLEGDELITRVDERPAYQLGHGMFPLASAYLEQTSVVEMLRPHLAELAEMTGWTANFGVLDGAEVVHLCVVFPSRPIHYATTEGSSYPAYRTGLGKAILSCLDDEDVRRALPEEPYPRFTEHTLTSWQELSANLRRARAQGFAVDEEESDVGLRCLAVPILTSAGVTAAVSVSGASGEGGPDRVEMMVKALRHTAEKIRALPAVPPALLTHRRHR